VSVVGINKTQYWGEVLTLAGLNVQIPDKIPDNYFDGMPVLEKMMERGNIDTEETGDRIVEPLMLGANDTAEWYAGYDTLNTTPQDNYSVAEFQWKQLSVSVVISGRDLRSKNPKQIKSLWKAKTENAIISAKDILSRRIMAGDGTGSQGKEITGFPAMIPENPTNDTYGGLPSATLTKWQNYYKSVGDTFANVGIKEMITAWIQTSRNRRNGVPDIIINTPALYQQIEVSQLGKQHYIMTTSGQKLDPAFGAIWFKGIPMEFDMNMPLDSGGHEQQVGINTRYSRLRIHPDANFAMTPFVKPANQDCIAAENLTQLELTCTNRRHNWRLFGWS
jgi:hypothetical protein